MWSPTRINSYTTAFQYLTKQLSTSEIKREPAILYADDRVFSNKSSIESVGKITMPH